MITTTNDPMSEYQKLLPIMPWLKSSRVAPFLRWLPIIANNFMACPSSLYASLRIPTQAALETLDVQFPRPNTPRKNLAVERS
ncbi:MAG: hypothetical protein PHD13_04590 [Methanocellales archaeon]|nr:hypothetical protein [Methanocellales archaeon]MDD5235430.1 hypothetical protein [Methanocellales archaeon]MDD5484487.1 hypothetical protein [Methanocellales archaeon]